jgi:hypothetical protein
MVKRLLRCVGRNTKLEHFRTFRWYVSELEKAGFSPFDYRSLNIFVLDRMPHKLVLWLQKFELSHLNSFPFSAKFLQRHGSDLKIRATIQKN